MTKREQINFRLDRVASDCGTTVSGLVRLMVVRFVKDVDRNGGKIVLPPESMDLPHRSERSRLAAEDRGTYKTARRPEEDGE
jgi:hypothetical protein